MSGYSLGGGASLWKVGRQTDDNEHGPASDRDEMGELPLYILHVFMSAKSKGSRFETDLDIV